MQLIDGGMLAFAAFHAMKDKVEYPLTHQMPLMLAKIVAEAEDTFTVFWDAEHLWKRKLWRSYRDRPEIWDAAGREDFYNMFAVLSALGVLQFRAGDLEADESLAALVHSLDGAEPLLIRSDDKDFMQLLSPSTWMYGRVRGVVKPAQVEGILGVPVEHVADWLALAGDKADGIPPLVSSGEAARLLRKHGRVRDWLDGDVTEPALTGLLARAGDQLRVNYQLVDLCSEAVGGVPAPSVAGFGDRPIAQDLGRKLGIAHLSELDAMLLPLATWGVRTVEQLVARGLIE
jgi:5'-3' exonuclease